MAHIEIVVALDNAVKMANKTVQEGGYLTGEEIMAMFIEAGESVDYVRKPAVSVEHVGNECCGDVSGLDKICTITSIKDNWIYGHLDNFKFCAKIFNEQSTHGISNGRVSKIRICDTSQEHWGADKCYINYDRGWDIYPTTGLALTFLNSILEALGDDEVSDEELLYYELYCYETVEDFENRNVAESFGSFSYKEDALSEANEYPEYERIKVRSSDGEDITIIEHEPIEDE